MHNIDKRHDSNTVENHFTAPWYMSSGIVQTLLNSVKFRNRGTGEFEKNSLEKIINAGDGVRLQGFLTEQKTGTTKGLVILFHGWEGSEKSAYMVSTGRFFYKSGYNVFRLNMRDHGNSHHLNKGLFLGTLIDEAFNAVKQINFEFSGEMPTYLAGFSMGANFSVRVARLASKENFSGLKHVFAVNPPIDPFGSTVRIDEIILIKKYFLNKWKKSLALKQSFFPDLYDFNSILSEKTCISMTDLLLKKYTSFGSLQEYFSKYNLKEGYLDSITVPLTVLTSEDDPIIPYEDIVGIERNPSVKLILQKKGGHCGYIMNTKFESWYLPEMLKAFENTVRQ